jgi:hypothetical protein
MVGVNLCANASMVRASSYTILPSAGNIGGPRALLRSRGVPIEGRALLLDMPSDGSAMVAADGRKAQVLPRFTREEGDASSGESIRFGRRFGVGG